VEGLLERQFDLESQAIDADDVQGDRVRSVHISRMAPR
jgi:hypothetical protein